MSLKLNIIIIFIIFQVFGFSTILTTSAAVGDIETPKVATIGSNIGNISSNAAGGRYYFNLSIVSGNSYDFQLTGDSNTKFYLFFFNSKYYPTIIQDESAEYTDTNSYLVKYEGYTTGNSWAFIMVFSNHVDGGIGDFTITISEMGIQTSLSSSTVDSTSTTSDNAANPFGESDDTDSPGISIITGSFAIIVVVAILSIKRKKVNY
jgi:hypothetical protein